MSAGKESRTVIVAEPMFRMPPAPQTLEQTGVGMDTVLELVTKTLHIAGELTGIELAAPRAVRAFRSPCVRRVRIGREHAHREDRREAGR